MTSGAGPRTSERHAISVIVPVFDPGPLIAPLIDSLLSQTMPAGRRELVFVDDGSSDGTPERLDALAAEHPDVQVIHIPNSGWPGRPRNVGLDAARGEFVFFADHDDWLEPDALRSACTPPRWSIEPTSSSARWSGTTAGVHRISAVSTGTASHAGNAPLGLLTPHKLFRRAMLEAHGIRFPEGEQRLEDHLFAVPAFFAAERISVLVSHPVYHWARRPDRENASHRRPAPAPTSTRYERCWRSSTSAPSRGRCETATTRTGTAARCSSGSATGGHQRDADYRAQVYAAGRALIADRFPPRLDDTLAFNLGLRARLVRRDDPESLERLATFESGLRARARVISRAARGRRARVEVTGRLWRQRGAAIAVVRRGERLLWEPPPELAHDVRRRRARRHGLSRGPDRRRLRSQEEETEWALSHRDGDARARGGRRQARVPARQWPRADRSTARPPAAARSRPAATTCV